MNTIQTTMIRFVGRSLEGRPLTPPKSVVDGNQTIQLPSEAEQLQGFSLKTTEETLTVARLFPNLYKVFIKKGEKP